MSRAQIRLRTHFCTLVWILRTSPPSKSHISLFLLYLTPNLNCSCRSHDLALKALKNINSLDFEAGNDVKSKNKPQKWVRHRILSRRRPVSSSERDIAHLSLFAAEKISPLTLSCPDGGGATYRLHLLARNQMVRNPRSGGVRRGS